MDHVRRARAPPRGTTWLGLLVVAICFTVAIPTAAVADRTSVSPAPALAAALDTDTISANSGQFAARAGYSASQVASASDLAPAVGPEDVVVTFSPTNPSFYDVPAGGTAPMSITQIADDYGVPVAEYTSAEQYFESRGLSILHSWPDRLSLSVAGTAAEVGYAFGTSLVSGTHDGRAVTFPRSAPSLPGWLEAEVESVSGLTTGFDQFTLPETPAVPVTPNDSGATQNPGNLITPTIARDIYGVSGLYNLTKSPTYASGRGVVLLLWGLGYDPSDIQTFFSDYYPSNFPAPKVTPYPVDGAPAPSPNAPNDPSNGSRELTLDIEWSGSMAPGANLDAVYAPPGPASNGYSPTDSSMVDALNEAVTPASVPGVSVISMSFGSADGGDSTLMSGFESDFAVAAHEGITLFAATGDTGGDANTGCSGGPEPEYPSASPQVVAVGGTNVALQRGPLGGITGFSESAWDQSGGGFSTEFLAPSWQEVGSAKAPISANGHRGMPDVSASADYNFLYFNGGQAAGGGTSFSTPLWAGMVAEMDALRGTNFGLMDPQLYQVAADNTGSTSPFHDITTGSNCLGPAGPGWDTATGWGSPVAVLLYEHLVASFVNVTIAANPSPVAPGGAVTVTATITNASNGAAIVGVTATVVLASTGLGGPCSGTFGSVAPVSNVTGQVVGTISIPDCYLGSQASVTVTVTGGGYYGTTSTTVDVNLLGLSASLAPLANYPNNIVLFAVIMGLAIAAGTLLGRGVKSGQEPYPPAVPPPGVAPSAPPSPPPPPTAPSQAFPAAPAGDPPPPPPPQ
jgi:kumamolisin